MKELKALLPLINYKAPSSRTLKDKFQVLFLTSFHKQLNRLNIPGVCGCSRRLHHSFHVPLSQEVGAKKDRLDFEQFHKFYNLIMFEQNEVV